MKAEFVPLDLYAMTDNPFKLIADDWMLITAGTPESFNTMTASWGALGELWNKKVCFVFVRPTRYTYEFMERSEYFTLSFFEEKLRPILNFCGRVSGRDMNKAEKAGLTPVTGTTGLVYFAEARMVIECRKVYYQDIIPSQFLDASIHDNYPKKDYHRMYVGEVVQCLIRRES
ncbi:MAG: flavin reductase family protein [Candidatus Zixiibacteriota bacterium]